jgi:hypothetical protein
MNNRILRVSGLIVSLVLGAPAASGAEGTFPVEDEFLSVDLDQLTQKSSVEHGVDLAYEPPGTIERLAKYNKIMVDQPEVFLAKDSKYRGMKPDNAKAIVDLIRGRVTENMANRGYTVVEESGPDVLYLRLGLTDLYLQKKKRGILTYTPVGRVAHIGAELVMDMMSKVDIIEMALQAELQDSESEEVLAAMVIKRGARKDKETGQKLERMDFDEFRAVLQEYGVRFSCRLENTKLPEPQRIDCMDEKALAAAGYLSETQ